MSDETPEQPPVKRRPGRPKGSKSKTAPPPVNPYLHSQDRPDAGRTVEVFIPNRRGPRGPRSPEEMAYIKQHIIQKRLYRMTFADIAKDLGVHTRQVHGWYQEAMRDIPESAASVYRQEQLDVLDMTEAKALELIGRVHIAHSNGRVVITEDGEPVEDAMPILAAIKIVVDIETRKARLLGLDKPIKVDATTTEVTATDIEIAKLIGELNDRNATERKKLEASE